MTVFTAELSKLTKLTKLTKVGLQVMKKHLTEREKKIKRTLKALAKAHPVIADCKPLALLIHLQIREAHPELSKTQIGQAMRYHCNSYNYLKVLVRGGARYDLSGAENGTVTEDQIKIAKVSWGKILNIFKHSKMRKQARKGKPVPNVTSIDAKAKAKPTVVIKKRRRVAAGGNEQLSLNQAS